MFKPNLAQYRSGIRLVILTALLLTLATAPSGSAVAQSARVIWSAPIDLSNTPQSSAHPAIVADRFGYVHVFWSEDAGGPPQPRYTDAVQGINPGNAIMHKQWDGANWSEANDVLIVPGDPLAEYVSVAIDRDDRLHAVWTGISTIYYANAPAWGAAAAHAWSRPVVIVTSSARTEWESSVIVDTEGRVHILYATRGDEVGVYHTQSLDGGNTWESAIRLTAPFDALEHSISRLKIVTDGADRLHAIWTTVDGTGYGQAVYYARSTDGGTSWSAPKQMGYKRPGDFHVGWPSITSVGQSEIHLIYCAGPTHRGRYHRISYDGGVTWSEANYVITEMEGLNGPNPLLVDAAGQLHMIVNMRTIDQVFGMFYSQWSGTEWSPVIAITPAGAEVGAAHFTSATVRLGNEIHIVWHDIGYGEIYYMRGIIQNVTQTPALPLPPPVTPVTVTPHANRVPLPVARTAPAVANPAMPSNFVATNINPIVPAILATLALATGVVIWQRLFLNRR